MATEKLTEQSTIDKVLQPDNDPPSSEWSEKMHAACGRVNSRVGIAVATGAVVLLVLVVVRPSFVLKSVECSNNIGEEDGHNRPRRHVLRVDRIVLWVLGAMVVTACYDQVHSAWHKLMQ